MCSHCNLDVQLVRAIREGAAALPGDLERLRSYLTMIERLLHEKANDLEPSWDAACAIAAEIEALHALEASVAERAIAVSADTMAGIRTKLAIWHTLTAGSEEDDMSTPRNRLILSIEADLRRLGLQAQL